LRIFQSALLTPLQFIHISAAGARHPTQSNQSELVRLLFNVHGPSVSQSVVDHRLRHIHQARNLAFVGAARRTQRESYAACAAHAPAGAAYAEGAIPRRHRTPLAQKAVLDYSSGTHSAQHGPDINARLCFGGGKQAARTTQKASLGVKMKCWKVKCKKKMKNPSFTGSGPELDQD
jgi:hypothetical protein